MKNSSPSQSRILKCFLFTSLLYLSSPITHAAGNPALAKLSFAEIDRNHDGAIDAREAGPIPDLAALFNTLDKNQDGVLSEQEFNAASTPLS